ncbi:hypothetical protein B0H14DRAFT_2620317 [Mycena olivaceomarginata]|nr:hypothetical protein B0H14DRAFT_2620317 [Mycena olivaceomarginata]
MTDLTAYSERVDINKDLNDLSARKTRMVFYAMCTPLCGPVCHSVTPWSVGSFPQTPYQSRIGPSYEEKTQIITAKREMKHDKKREVAGEGGQEVKEGCTEGGKEQVSGGVEEDWGGTSRVLRSGQSGVQSFGRHITSRSLIPRPPPGLTEPTPTSRPPDLRLRLQHKYIYWALQIHVLEGVRIRLSDSSQSCSSMLGILPHAHIQPAEARGRRKPEKSKSRTALQNQNKYLGNSAGGAHARTDQVVLEVSSGQQSRHTPFSRGALAPSSLRSHDNTWATRNAT